MYLGNQLLLLGLIENGLWERAGKVRLDDVADTSDVARILATSA